MVYRQSDPSKKAIKEHAQPGKGKMEIGEDKILTKVTINYNDVAKNKFIPVKIVAPTSSS